MVNGDNNQGGVAGPQTLCVCVCVVISLLTFLFVPSSKDRIRRQWQIGESASWPHRLL